MDQIAVNNSREAINKERERIKNANEQNLLSVLTAQGIDGTKIPRHEFDKLLRIQKEMAVHEREMQHCFKQFSEIVAPYRTVTVSPDISDEISHAPLEPNEEIPVAEAQAQQ